MVNFVNFITKGIEFEKDGDRRLFSGHITAEVVDHQNDFIFVSEVMKIMDTFMKVMPVISEVHTNRMIGKALKYEKSEIEGVASVKVYMEIFKQKGVSLYDDVWKKIKSREYSGLSMGGGSKKREPMFKDGRMVMKLSDLELYEIAVCPSPANPLAIIDKYNEFAKSEIMTEKQFTVDNRNIVQCSGISCSFGKQGTTVDEGKADSGLNKDQDVDIDNKKKPGEITDNENKTIVKQGATSGNMEELGDDSRVPQPGKVHEHESGDVKENQQNLAKIAPVVAGALLNGATVVAGAISDNVVNSKDNDSMEKAPPQVKGAIAAEDVNEQDVRKQEVPHVGKDELQYSPTRKEVPYKPHDDKEIRQFDKDPEEIEKHHIPGFTDEQEEEAKKKNKEIGKADVEFKENITSGKKEWLFWQIDMESHKKVEGTEQTVLASSYGQAIDDYIANWNTEHKDNTTGYPMAQGCLKDDVSKGNNKPDLAGRIEKSEYEPVLLEYLKTLDVEVEKKDNEILKLKSRIVEITLI